MHLDTEPAPELGEALHQLARLPNLHHQVVPHKRDAAVLLRPREEDNVLVALQALARVAPARVRVLETEDALVPVPRDPDPVVVGRQENRVEARRARPARSARPPRSTRSGPRRAAGSRPPRPCPTSSRPGSRCRRPGTTSPSGAPSAARSSCQSPARGSARGSGACCGPACRAGSAAPGR